MKIEKIKTNSEGLKKIIDFLHSEMNTFWVGEQRKITERFMVFGLEQVVHVPKRTNIFSDVYEVTIAQEYINVPKNNFDALFDLLKGCYNTEYTE